MQVSINTFIAHMNELVSRSDLDGIRVVIENNRRELLQFFFEGTDVEQAGRLSELATRVRVIDVPLGLPLTVIASAIIDRISAVQDRALWTSHREGLELHHEFPNVIHSVLDDAVQEVEQEVQVEREIELRQAKEE